MSNLIAYVGLGSIHQNLFEKISRYSLLLRRYRMIHWPHKSQSSRIFFADSLYAVNTRMDRRILRDDASALLPVSFNLSAHETQTG